jgi:biopolymer transport protein ExbD
MSSRRHQQQPTPGVNLGLIITPMLDMSFQILSFFIMTYHPSALEGHISGSLAPPEKTAQKSKENLTPDLIPPSVPEELLLPEIQEAPTVTVKTNRDDPGKPAKVYLTRDKTQTEPAEVADATTAEAEQFDQKWKQAKKELSHELRRLKKDAADQGDIKMQCDGELRQEYVMEVYDICKQAGFPRIHFVPPPQLRKTEK